MVIMLVKRPAVKLSPKTWMGQVVDAVQSLADAVGGFIEACQAPCNETTVRSYRGWGVDGNVAERPVEKRA